MVLIDGVRGGFFLKKKPHKLVLSVYSNSETARAQFGKGRKQGAAERKVDWGVKRNPWRAT
jgi:hypothetical protein